MRQILVGLLAGMLAAVAAADVTVSFKEPEKFSDIKDNTGFNRLEVLKDLEAQMKKQAERLLPGRDVSITVIDVDLAGEVEPIWRTGQWVRLLRDITVPAISLTYEIREQGQVVRQGEMALRDINYREGFNRYPESDPLRYDRRLIDRGFEKEFGAAAVAAVPASAGR
ncbi:MAG: DUF3016 domain-containing protein [Roseateles depolymerans]|uniref:DUF3016 domain-containing protein n=1 Tax=Roseateles depolymerans TaxID=76731 RepID=A0A2W5DRW4_9BURK|nr:MAG: DUF3016 domain-containing protein [Roseateles depolymerans]